MRPALLFFLAFLAPTAKAADVMTRSLWSDATPSTIGNTAGWSHKVEIADIDNDGLVDLLFSNGGDHHTKGAPETNQIFRNGGADRPFQDITSRVLGPTRHSSRAIRVADLNADGLPDIVTAGSYETQSRLLLGVGDGRFSETTSSHLPPGNFSFGDVKLGDVDDGVQVGCDSCNRNHVFRNDGRGGYVDATPDWWPDDQNPAQDDNQVVFLDFDSDGDPDFLVGSLSGPDLLLVNHLTSSSRKLEVHREAFVGNETPVMPHDWYRGNREGRAVTVRALDKAKRVLAETPMRWYGELLWRAKLPHSTKIKSLVITAQDAAGNRTTSTFPISGQPKAMRD